MTTTNLIVKPSQGQKTKEIIGICNSKPSHKCVVISQNRKSDADQMEAHFMQFASNKNCHIMHGSAKEGSMKSEDVARRVASGDFHNLFVLANKVQLGRLVKIIKLVQIIDPATEWLVFVDESDVTHPIVHTHLSELIEKRLFVPYHVTATPTTDDKFWRQHSAVALHRNKQGLDAYNSLKACDWIKVPHVEDGIVSDIVHLVERAIKDHPGPLSDMYMFAPTDMRKTAHEITAIEVSRACDVNVIVKNGEGFAVFTPDSSRQQPLLRFKPSTQNMCEYRNPKDGRCMKPLCKGCDKTPLAIIEGLVAMIRSDFGCSRPILLTGNKCIKRASTLHSDKMPFTAAVFSHALMRTPSGEGKDTDAFKRDLYQCVARIAGSFERVSSCRVYYNDDNIMTWALGMESIATNISAGGGELTRSDLRTMYDANGAPRRVVREAYKPHVLLKRFCAHNVGFQGKYMDFSNGVKREFADECDEMGQRNHHIWSAELKRLVNIGVLSLVSSKPKVYVVTEAAPQLLLGSVQVE